MKKVYIETRKFVDVFTETNAKPDRIRFMLKHLNKLIRMNKYICLVNVTGGARELNFKQNIKSILYTGDEIHINLEPLDVMRDDGEAIPLVKLDLKPDFQLKDNTIIVKIKRFEIRFGEIWLFDPIKLAINDSCARTRCCITFYSLYDARRIVLGKKPDDILQSVHQMAKIARSADINANVAMCITDKHIIEYIGSDIDRRMNYESVDKLV